MSRPSDTDTFLSHVLFHIAINSLFSVGQSEKGVFLTVS